MTWRKSIKQALVQGLRLSVKDSLAKRLFVLLWLSLVLSHMLAFGVVRFLHFPPPHAEAAPGPRPDEVMRLPTFPSLPPGPGLEAGPGPAPGNAADALAPSAAAPKNAGLSGEQLLLDYGLRLLVIALAAWLGSRWLAQPMQRLTQAAAGLEPALKGRAALPVLDEKRGTYEVREAARLFNQMAQQLLRHFKERGLFLAAISHDLRTPLTRLRMRLETLELAEPARRAAVRDVQEIAQLIEAVLEVFQAEGLAASEATQTVDLSALLGALCDDLQEQGQRLSCTGPPALVQAQTGALRRALGNLLGNALRYGGEAHVRLSVEAGWVRVSIEDPGPGIPEDQLEAVFQAFYRLESSRNRHTGGLGLGLYIARDLLQRQGGRLQLRNRPEGGLSAEIELPCVQP